jgi:hypothetical protein
MFWNPRRHPRLSATAWEIDFHTYPVLHSRRTPELLQNATYNLQHKLVAEGLLEPAQVTGRFNPATQQAVEAFQRRQGLKVDGVVGPLTWAALFFPTLALQTTSGKDPGKDSGKDPGTGPIAAPGPDLTAALLRLQTMLVKEGFQSEITGTFDRATERALRRFQRYYGLRPDGVCGPITWTMLLGQRPAPVPDLWPWSRLSYRGERIAEQLLIVGAVWMGMLWNPLGIEQAELSLLAALVVAYGLTMVGPLVIDKLLPQAARYDHHPMLRYAPYVMVGLLWSPILGAVTELLSQSQ